jgi:hypothetical protein
MFPVSEHTAEKVQQDVNAILSAIAQWLAKVKLGLPESKQDADLPPVQWNAALDNQQVIDLEALPEFQVLPSSNPNLLLGNDALLLSSVQLQIGTTQIAGFLPEVREQLEELPPEQIADLRRAIAQPTGDKEFGEAVDIQVNGVTVLHRDEQGQMTVNELSPVHSHHSQIELRPVAEVEMLVGHQLSDSSAIHDQVIQHAPSVLVTVDDQGHIKPGSYLREQVEATEDEVEASVEADQQQALTPAAIAVIQSLQNRFIETGEQELVCSDYTFKSEGDRVLIVPNHHPDQMTVVEGNSIQSAIGAEQYQDLMQRFTRAYEQIQGYPNREPYKYSDDYELA